MSRAASKPSTALTSARLATCSRSSSGSGPRRYRRARLRASGRNCSISVVASPLIPHGDGTQGTAASRFRALRPRVTARYLEREPVVIADRAYGDDRALGKLIKPIPVHAGVPPKALRRPKHNPHRSSWRPCLASQRPPASVLTRHAFIRRDEANCWSDVRGQTSTRSLGYSAGHAAARGMRSVWQCL